MVHLCTINLHVNEDLDRRYGPGVVLLGMKGYQTYTVHISDDLKDSDGRIHNAWIVHPVFNT